MAPIVACPLLPEIQSGRKNGAVKPRSKLLDPAEKGFCLSKPRHRLNDSGTRIPLHQTDQRRNGLTSHHAVGIEDHHVAVAMTPTATKIRDVSALPIHGKFAPAIMNLTESTRLTADVRPRQLLFHRFGRVGRITQNIKIVRIK